MGELDSSIFAFRSFSFIHAALLLRSQMSAAEPSLLLAAGSRAAFSPCPSPQSLPPKGDQHCYGVLLRRLLMNHDLLGFTSSFWQGLRGKHRNEVFQV